MTDPIIFFIFKWIHSFHVKYKRNVASFLSVMWLIRGNGIEIGNIMK